MKYFILVLLVTSLFSDSDRHHSERHINKELSHLKLSKTQNTNIKKILKDFRFDLKEFREYKEEIEEKREKIFINEFFDIKKLNKLNHELDIKSHDIENRLLKKLHPILSKKQREKFIDYFDDWEVE